jgi:hypothetical protein
MHHDAIRKRNILFGGDYANALVANSAAGMTWAYDPVADVGGAANHGIALLSKRCNGPGNVEPSYPNDGQAGGMDYQKDCFWVNEGGWNLADGTVCNIAGNSSIPSIPGSVHYRGLLRMHPTTGIWTGVSKDLVNPGVKNGYFDPVQRCLVGVDGSGAINRVYVDTLTRSLTPINFLTKGCVVRPPGRLVPSGGYLDGHDWAMDIVGRWGYVISTADFWPDLSGKNLHKESFFWRFNLDKPSIQEHLTPTTLPFGGPQNYQTYPSPGSYMIHLSWDSRNRKVIWFYQRALCGMVHGIGVYTPSTGQWETLPILQDQPVGLNRIIGNCVGYDSTNNVHILTGGVFCGPGSGDPKDDTAVPGYYSLWRYA